MSGKFVFRSVGRSAVLFPALLCASLSLSCSVRAAATPQPASAAGETLGGGGGMVLCRDGRSDYVIVVAPEAPSSVRTAAKELQGYFQKSAGATLPLVSSAPTDGKPFFSIGATPVARAAGVTTAGIKNDGYRLATRGRNVFILGPDTRDGEVTRDGGPSDGTANGVYHFCEKYLGVRWLMPGPLGEETPHQSVVALPAASASVRNWEEVYSPPFDYRNLSTIGHRPDGLEWGSHHLIGRPTRVTTSHSWTTTIPPALFNEHPDWFAQIDGKPAPIEKTQRYKLETTNPALVQAFADHIIQAFRANPNLHWYALSPNDGSAYWSNSPAALALTEKDPHGGVSRTRLVLKFYDDVAAIVAKQFPDHRLGGYLYASYLYPPSGPMPPIAPNLTLQVATSISYGYQLYRPSTQEDWDKIMREWRTKLPNTPLYYYDLPTVLVARTPAMLPPAPEILGFIFPRLTKYGYQGLYMDGSPDWAANGAGNYLIAELMWNPQADPKALLHDYCRTAFGEAAAPHMEKLYADLGDGYRTFYIRHPEMNYSLTPAHLAEIYAPLYRTMETEYLAAHDAAHEPRQRQRLELYGAKLSHLQNVLKSAKLLPSDYHSALTVSESPESAGSPFAQRDADL